MAELEEKSASFDDDDSAVGVPNSSESTATVTVGDYAKVWDADYGVWYFVSNATGESFWEVEVDGSGLWMEVLDEASQYYYYLHAETGESIWAEEATGVSADGSTSVTDEGYFTSVVSAVAWEELTDPLSGWSYYYSHVNGVSQWAPPAWMDYVDADSGSVYYLHLESGESSWEKPSDFVEEAWDDSDLYDWSTTHDDGGYGSSSRNGLDSNAASTNGGPSTEIPGADMPPTPPAANSDPAAAFSPAPPPPPAPAAPLSPLPSAPPMEEEFEEGMPEPPPPHGVPPPAYDSVAAPVQEPANLASSSSLEKSEGTAAPSAHVGGEARGGAVALASGAPFENTMDGTTEASPPPPPLPLSSRAATAHVPPSSAPRNPVAKRGPPWAANESLSGGPSGTSSSLGRTDSEASSASNGPGYALSKRPRGKQPGLAAYPLRGGAILSPEQPQRGTNYRPPPPPHPPTVSSSSTRSGIPPPPGPPVAATGRSLLAAAYLRAASAKGTSGEAPPPAAATPHQAAEEVHERAAAVLPPPPPTATQDPVVPFPPAPPPFDRPTVPPILEETSNEMDEAH